MRHSVHQSFSFGQSESSEAEHAAHYVIRNYKYGGGGNRFPERRSVFYIDGEIGAAYVSHTITILIKCM